MKLRVSIATATLGAVALIGLAACGPFGSTDSLSSANALSPEASALASLGVPTDQLQPVSDTSPAPNASTPPGVAASPNAHPRLHRLALRRELGRNVEHGEIVVKTNSGDKTVDVQRGTVTAINSTSMTVKSADGYTLTWTFGNPIHVLENRTSVQPSSVTTGEQVAVAGARGGSGVTASLIVLPHGK